MLKKASTRLEKIVAKYNNPQSREVSKNDAYSSIEVKRSGQAVFSKRPSTNS